MTALLDDIANKLVLDSVVDGSTGWVVVRGYLPPTPDKVIAVFETGGEDPDQTEGTKYDEPTFQLRFRGGEFGYEELRNKAQEAFASLNDATILNYVYVFAVTSGPIAIGYDANNRPEVTWNFRTMRVRQT